MGAGEPAVFPTGVTEVVAQFAPAPLEGDSLRRVCYISPSTCAWVEGVMVEPTAEFAQLQLSFVDQTQWRYEVIRPLVLFADRTASQRAQETETHPDTVRTLQRRFRQQGMPGLLPADVEVVPRRRASPIPEA
jgi:hypothetical protein